MTQQVQAYEQLQLVSAEAGDGVAADAQPAASPQLLPMLRRRWKMALGLWLLLGAVGVAGAWTFVKPTFVAFGQIEVAPVVPAILYQDDEKPIPLFDTYLNTQAQLASSQQVLTAALADPGVQATALIKAADPQAALRKSLTVTTVPKTHLMQIEVKQEKAEDAVLLAKAVLNGYMVRAVGADAQNERTRREILEKKREELRARLDQLTGEIRKLAETYGTASDTMFEVLRQEVEKNTAQTRQELEKAELDILQVEQQLTQARQGVTLETSDQQAAQRDEAIESDAGVRYLKQQRDTAASRVARLRAAGLPAENRDVKDAQAGLQRVQDELTQERARAAADIDKELAERVKQRAGDVVRRLEESLKLAKQRRDLLQARVKARDTEGMQIGKKDLEIQSLREQKESAKQEYDRVTDALKQLSMESLRPTRISIASSPEVRPREFMDSQKKACLGALFGALAFACAVSWLRDRLDPQLHGTQEVESSVHLRVLGAVPSIADLRARRVTKDDFLESYRCIRTTLSGISREGAVPRTLLITSAQAAEGKTSLAVSLAVSFAESGERVLLVDGDVQAPQIAKLLKLNPPRDLKSVLAGDQTVEAAAAASTIKRVDVLVARRNGESLRTLLNVTSAERLVQQAAGLYDRVIIDSPPSLGAADALVWARAADGIIISSLVGHTNKTALNLACERLRTVGGRMLGAVIANVSSRESYYSYSATSCSQVENGLTDGRIAVAPRRPLVHLPDGTTTGSGAENPESADA